MRRLLLCAAVLAPCGAYAQDAGGQLATLRDVQAFEQTWRYAAILPKGPMTPQPPSVKKRDRVQAIVDESDCRVDWHSQRRKRPSRITCFARE
jgi:hypothetical protein